MTQVYGESKRRHLPWYKRCPADWQQGTRRHNMSFELRGFYSECLDAMWELQGELPKDDKALAMMLGSNPRKVRALMTELIALGKMIETENGYYNPRMMADINRSNQHRTNLEPTLNQHRKLEKTQSFLRETLEAEAEAEKKEDTNVGPNTKSASGPDEISGLNGSTAEIVGGIAKFLNSLSPDFETARRVVSSNCGLYGDQAVRDGYAELMADVEDRKIRVPSVKVLVGYFKIAKDRGAKAPKATAKSWSEERNERARALMATLKTGGVAA